MTTDQSKVMDLAEAVARFVKPGAHISVGGFTLNRNPMAATYEVIRQGLGDLHLYVHSNGVAVDELIGAGLVKRLEIAYGGVGKTTPTCIRFRKAIQDGTIQFEDYSNFMMALRFLAGSLGVPYLPTRSGLGTDIVEKWGFPAEMRATEERIPDQKLIVAENPFGDWGGAEKLLLVPAINPDVCLLHVQQADPLGTSRIEGLTFADLEQAKASKEVILTCEELVETEVLRQEPDRNLLPMFHVSAVCHVPYGAFPTAVYKHYDYDPAYLQMYDRAAKDDALFKEYQQKYIYNVKTHDDFLELIGPDRLAEIKADPVRGYTVQLKRD